MRSPGLLAQSVHVWPEGLRRTTPTDFALSDARALTRTRRTGAKLRPYTGSKGVNVDSQQTVPVVRQ